MLYTLQIRDGNIEQQEKHLKFDGDSCIHLHVLLVVFQCLWIMFTWDSMSVN